MEAAAEAAVSAGGLTIGLLPGTDPAEACPHMDIAIPTGLGEARNYLVATAAQGVIAIGGSLGTLSELAFALKKRLPVAALATWAVETERLPDDAVLYRAQDPADAVRFIFDRICPAAD